MQIGKISSAINTQLNLQRSTFGLNFYLSNVTFMSFSITAERTGIIFDLGSMFFWSSNVSHTVNMPIHVVNISQTVNMPIHVVNISQIINILYINFQGQTYLNLSVSASVDGRTLAFQNMLSF